jgi:hypothetical protein
MYTLENHFTGERRTGLDLLEAVKIMLADDGGGYELEQPSNMPDGWGNYFFVVWFTKNGLRFENSPSFGVWAKTIEEAEEKMLEGIYRMMDFDRNHWSILEDQQ